MRIQYKGGLATILIVACFTLVSFEVLQGVEARVAVVGSNSHDHERVKRGALSNEDREYLIDLYVRFQEVFNDRYQRTQNSIQFAVAAIGHPNNLTPCNLVMNSDQGQISSARNNYLAYTPRPSPTRPNGQIHAEISIMNNFTAATQGLNNLGRVDLVSHFVPCRFCSDRLRQLIQSNTQIRFYVGYVEMYQNEDITNYFIQQVGNLDNVCFGQIQPHTTPCPPGQDELRRRSATCPVRISCVNSGSGSDCFPFFSSVQSKNSSSTSLKKMEDLMIGDEVLAVNEQGHLVYTPIIAFLDRAPSDTTKYIVIETENNHKLHLSFAHLMFTNDSSKPVYASDIEPGKYIFTLGDQENSLQLSKVTHVDTTSAVGKYAPLTEEGTIFVDGVLASCYAGVSGDQSDIHSLFAPLRVLHNTFPRLSNSDHQLGQEGIHWYANTLMQMRSYMKEYVPDVILPSLVTG